LAIARNPRTTTQVFFIARGIHLEKIQERGLILNTDEHKGLVCRPSIATDDVRKIPPPDLYLLCVKSYDLDEAVTAIGKSMRRKTIIIPLLNGVDIRERIRTILRKGIVLPSCAYVGTHIEEPGVVTQRGGGVILSGKDPQYFDFDPGEVQALFEEVSVPFEWHDDSYPAIWEKYIFIAAFGLVTAYTGKTLAEVMADPEAREITRQVMEETAAIACKKGVLLAEHIVEACLAKAYNFPPETRTSYQRDIEVPGRKNEGDLFGRTIIRLGVQLGVPTPVTEFVYAAIEKRLKRSAYEIGQGPPGAMRRRSSNQTDPS